MDLDKEITQIPPYSHYRVEFVWNSVPFERMKEGLARFQGDNEACSSEITTKILGRDPNNHQATPQNNQDGAQTQRVKQPANIPNLNNSQKQAISKALKNNFTLIQGPPGTGKTTTSASLVYNLVETKLMKNIEGVERVGTVNPKILVSAPSNAASDILALRILKTGVKIIRMYSKKREKIPLNPDLASITLHNLAPEEDDQKDVLDQAEVICCTCSVSADERLDPYIFRWVLVDECTQAVEPECILPLVRGSHKAVLVGDHMQLGPVVQSPFASQAGLDLSFFSRMVEAGAVPTRLDIQFRMHPSICVFPSNCFYEGKLRSGVSEEERRIHSKVRYLFPREDQSTFFWHMTGHEMRPQQGKSYFNRQEAEAISELVACFVQNGVEESEIGVICAYKGQKNLVRRLVNDAVFNLRRGNGGPGGKSKGGRGRMCDVEVATIDSYQGREKEYIFISTVRSNLRDNLGFLVDFRRMNVSITRAKLGLIIVGDAFVLKNDKHWRRLLANYLKRGLVVEGRRTNSLNLVQRGFLGLDLEREEDGIDPKTGQFKAFEAPRVEKKKPPIWHFYKNRSKMRKNMRMLDKNQFNPHERYQERKDYRKNNRRRRRGGDRGGGRGGHGGGYRDEGGYERGLGGGDRDFHGGRGGWRGGPGGRGGRRRNGRGRGGRRW